MRLLNKEEKMPKVTKIKNVDCWGKLYEDCGVAVKTCHDYWVIPAKKNWTETVNYVLEDPYWAELAANNELELEVD